MAEGEFGGDATALLLRAALGGEMARSMAPRERITLN
jgi:hypothetical protein